MKLTDKIKNRLTVAGLSVVCVVLVISISLQFKTEAPKDVTVQPSSTVPDAVTPSIPPIEPSRALEASVQPLEPTAASAQSIDTGNSRGKDQNIQAEVTKPSEPLKEVLTDPSKTPDGEKIDKGKKPESKASSSTPKSGDKKDGKIYVPGFGWIDDNGGGGSGTPVGKPGDELTGNKVGSMD
jgi:hypothetical protein